MWGMFGLFFFLNKTPKGAGGGGSQPKNSLVGQPVDWPIQKYNQILKKVQKVLQKEPPSLAILRGSCVFLSFCKIMLPLGGGLTPKEYFEVTYRAKGVLHIKFGWNLSCSSAPNPNKQTNKHLCFIPNQAL